MKTLHSTSLFSFWMVKSLEWKWNHEIPIRMNEWWDGRSLPFPSSLPSTFLPFLSCSELPFRHSRLWEGCQLTSSWLVGIMAGKDGPNMVNPMVDADAVIVIARKRTNSSTNVIRKASDTRIIGNADLNYAMKVDKKLSENKIVGYEEGHFCELQWKRNQSSTTHRTNSLVLLESPRRTLVFLTKANLRRTRTTFHLYTRMVLHQRKLPDDW